MKYQIYPCKENANAAFIVFSSGLGGHASFWKPQLEQLNEYFNLLCYDQEGCHADSELLPLQYDFKDMALQVKDILIHEKIHTFHFIGHAIGAFIGTELAALENTPFNFLSLTYINAWDVLDPHTQKCFEARVELLKASGSVAYVRAQALFLFPPAWISKYYLQIQQAENEQLKDFPPTINVLARIQAAREFKINAQHLFALEEVPLHFIANQDDFLVPVQKSSDLKDKFKHGTLTILSSGGHASTVTASEMLNKTLLNFLSNIQE